MRNITDESLKLAKMPFIKYVYPTLENPGKTNIYCSLMCNSFVKHEQTGEGSKNVDLGRTFIMDNHRFPEKTEKIRFSS